jgi:hypothetical protein
MVVGAITSTRPVSKPPWGRIRAGPTDEDIAKGTVDYQTSTIDIFDDLKQGGNRRAPRTVARSSKQDSDPDQVID